MHTTTSRLLGSWQLQKEALKAFAKHATVIAALASVQLQTNVQRAPEASTGMGGNVLTVALPEHSSTSTTTTANLLIAKSQT
jgi:hypothetical protein